MTRLFQLLFLLPSLAAAQAFYTPGGALIIDICGSSSYTCAQDPKAPDSSYAGVGDQTSSISVGDDKSKDVLPSHESAPNPAAPNAPGSMPAAEKLVGAKCEASYNGAHASVGAACQAFAAHQFPAMRANGFDPVLTNASGDPLPSGCLPSSGLGNCSYTLYSGGAVQSYPIGSTTTSSVGTLQYACDAGYSLNGSTCVLLDAREAVPDGKEDINRDDGNYSRASPNDADHVLTNDSIAAVNGGNYQRSGYDSKGKPVHVEVMAQPAGGTTIIYTSGAAGGGYGVNQTTYNINNYGVVTGVSSNSGDGLLTVNPGTAGAAVSGNPGVTTPGSGGQTGSGLNPPTFPSDYAKSGEAAAAAKTITDRLDNTSEVDDPTLPQDQEFGDAFFKDTFTSLLAWQLPAHSSACPVGSFSWDGRIYSVDAHCQLIADHWSLLSQAMAVVWIIAALFIVLRA